MRTACCRTPADARLIVHGALRRAPAVMAMAGMMISAMLILLASAGAAAGGDAGVVSDARTQWAFAEKLAAEGRWTDAALEYRRFLHLFPRDSRVEEAMVRIGQAHFAAGDYSGAVHALKDLIDRYAVSDPAASPRAVEAYRLTARSYLEMGQAGKAVLELRNFIALTDDASLADDMRYNIGWILLSRGEVGLAENAFSGISTESAAAFRLPELQAGLDRYRNLPRKDPGIAGFLSVIPGLGQVYCERYNDALIAALINALAITATWEAFDGDNVTLGIGLGLLAAGFYSGNVYNAVSSAHKANRDMERRFIDRLRADFHLGAARGGAGHSVGFSLSARF